MTSAAPFLKWETLILLLAFQGLLVSSFQMIALDEPLCKYAGLTVLLVPTLTVMFVTYILLRYVRPSSSGRLVRWDEEKGTWASFGRTSETEGSHGGNPLGPNSSVASAAPSLAELSIPDSSASDVANERVGGHVERRRSSRSNSRRRRSSAIQARKSLIGSVALSLAELSSAPRGSLLSDASQPDVVIAMPADTPPTLARSLSRRLSESVRSSLSSELLSRYAHFFDAYVNVRYAWLTLPLLLVQQFVMAAFLGLGVPSGGCDYEQVLP
jgi:hypothetical protein